MLLFLWTTVAVGKTKCMYTCLRFSDRRGPITNRLTVEIFCSMSCLAIELMSSLLIMTGYRLRDLSHFDSLQSLSRLYLGMNRIAVCKCTSWNDQCITDVCTDFLLPSIYGFIVYCTMCRICHNLRSYLVSLI